MNRNFKKLGLKGIKFLTIVILVDFSFGFLAKEIYFNQETGKQARITYSLNETSADVLIFGSSHANRHYVPKVFEKELEQSCYNTGVQGQGVLFHATLQDIILKRTQPKTIILNVDDGWLYERKDSYDRLTDLHPYYWDHRDEIKPTLSLKSKLVDFKLLLKSYQNNSTLVHAFRYYIAPQKDFNGYLPLAGKMKIPDKPLLDESKIPSQTKAIDPNFLKAFTSFIDNAKKNNVAILLVVSPLLDNRDLSNDLSLNTMKRIAKEKNAPLLDLYEHQDFKDQYQLFDDFSHLNHEGASLFSKMVAAYIKDHMTE